MNKPKCFLCNAEMESYNKGKILSCHDCKVAMKWEAYVDKKRFYEWADSKPGRMDEMLQLQDQLEGMGFEK